ncbi:MAG: DmsE family decaheme c-type cytochrome [Deltaproteobacteria bacterium]|nr:DmsE family decaheme c-type cytochrome [Deltaproteobacteria bacterium]
MKRCFVLVCLSVFVFSTQGAAASNKTKSKKVAVSSSPSGPVMVGDSVCQACHQDQFVKFGKTLMGKYLSQKTKSGNESFSCETCHGPGNLHAEAGGGRGVGGLITFGKGSTTPVEKQNAVCLQCHEQGDRLLWKGSSHQARDVACTSCHTVMEKISPHAQLAKTSEIETCGQCHEQKRAQQMRFSHMPVREGKMTCTSCHNPHGTLTEKLLKSTSANENCYSCHTEKRGPFLWEHPPVMENCINCHDPHGSNHEKMLKLPKPRLCQQCHDESRHPTNPQSLGATRTLFGRSCSNCHFNIHGSNHPSGSAFTR